MKNKNQARGELIFISGGVRSGKSSFAEKEAIRYAQAHNQPLNYIATSHREDEEMKERIHRHEQQRLRGGATWNTFEIPHNFREDMQTLTIDGVVLLDCLTVLLANELFARLVPEARLQQRSEEIAENIVTGITILRKKVQRLFIVSNEIHYEIHDDPYVQAYQRTLGRLHQQIVKKGTAAYLVEATIPRLMKGNRG